MTANPADPGNLHHRRNCTRPDPQVTVDVRGTRLTCPSCHRYVFTHAENHLGQLTPDQEHPCRRADPRPHTPRRRP